MSSVPRPPTCGRDDWSTVAPVLEHHAHLPDRHGRQVPQPIRDPPQWCVHCCQQGLTGDHEHRFVWAKPTFTPGDNFSSATCEIRTRDPSARERMPTTPKKTPFSVTKTASQA